MECQHLVGLAITELQAPDKRARPAVHTVVAIVRALFPDEDLETLDLVHHSLVARAWLVLDGQGPVPQQSLFTPAAAWCSLLDPDAPPWPGCHWLESDNPALLGANNLHEGSTIATLMAAGDDRQLNNTQRQINTVVVRGQPGSGRGLFAAQLARQLAMRAIEVPFELWQRTPVLHSLCEQVAWLPVLRPVLGPGETLRLPAASPMVVILGTDGAIDADHMVEVLLQLPNQTERLALWQTGLWQRGLGGAAPEEKAPEAETAGSKEEVSD